MNCILKTTLAAAAASMALGAVSAPASAAVFVTQIKIKNAIGTYLQVAEVQAWSGATDVALVANGGSASATSVYAAGVSTPGKAIDGNTGGDYYTDTIYHGSANNGSDVLTIDLAGANLSSLSIFGRTDGGFGVRDIYTYELYDSTGLVGSGTINAQSGSGTAALPEPSTWALMLMGFGMVGYGLRRRQKQTVRVAYA